MENELKARVATAQAALAEWASIEGGERGYVLEIIQRTEMTIAAERRDVETMMKTLRETRVDGDPPAFADVYESDMQDRLARLWRLANSVTLAKIVMLASVELGGQFVRDADVAATDDEFDAVAKRAEEAREALRGKWGVYFVDREVAIGPFDTRDAAIFAAAAHAEFSLVRDKLDGSRLAQARISQITLIDPAKCIPDADEVLDIMENRAYDDVSGDDAAFCIPDWEAANAELTAVLGKWASRHVGVEVEWYVSEDGEPITEDDLKRLSTQDARQMELPHVEKA
jgi:hypothetical protein